MPHVIDEYCSNMVDGDAGLAESRVAFDAVASMPAGFANAWDIEQVVDPFGDRSIIVLPAHDSPELPTFLFYMRNGLSRIATIRDDVWEGDEDFSSCPLAVAAILAAIPGLRLPGRLVRPAMAHGH